MSKSAPERQPPFQPDHPAERSKEVIRQALKQLDEKLIYLKENVIPPQPYLLSVPTDNPYRIHKAFLRPWPADTPFGPHEEQLQYMSFHLHQNLGEDLLKVVGGWSDAEGNLMEEDSYSQSQTLSVQTTPVQLPSRKKISLKDYKTKDKASHTPLVPETASKGPKQAMKSERHPTGVKIANNRKPDQDASRKSVQINGTSEATVSKVVRTSKQQQLPPPPPPPPPPPIIREPDSPSPRKRRRLSSEDPASDQERMKVSEREGKGKKPLPALLSPTLPAAEKRRANKELPDLLSPKLPAALERVLADTQPKRSEQVKAILGEALGSSTAKKVVAGDRSSTEPVRVKSEGHLSSKSLPSASKTSPHIKPVVATRSRPGTPTQNPVQSSPRPRQRHVISLRYGKKNRRRVEALLKLSTPKKAGRPAEDGQARRLNEASREPSKVATTSVKVEKKRPPEHSPERSVKKLKPMIQTPERPSTPLTATKSPAIPTSAKRIDTQITPRKELKPSAMQRIASTGGTEAKTPPVDRGRTSTPVGGGMARESPAPNSSSAARDTERATWMELNTKFFALGRQLKREAQQLATSRNENEQNLAVINHIEALLCFMINLSAQSHARPSVDPGWETILPYFIFVFKASRRQRHLHGLVIQLGAMCRQIWHGHNIDRLHRDPLPDESCNAAPTPGSDGNTKTDDGERYKKKYLEFKNQLVQNSRELQSAWLDGSRYLSPHLLEQEYPKTWARRSKDATRRGLDKIMASKIADKFYLPLDSNSTVFEASRFAIALMEEWSAKERISWKCKIEL